MRIESRKGGSAGHNGGSADASTGHSNDDGGLSYIMFYGAYSHKPSGSGLVPVHRRGRSTRRTGGGER